MNETHLKLLRECVDAGEKATKGEWANDDPSWKELNDITVWAPDGDTSICNMGGSFAACGDKGEAQQNFDNGAFIASAANAREGLKAMLAEYEAMQAEIARLYSRLSAITGLTRSELKENSDGK